MEKSLACRSYLIIQKTKNPYSADFLIKFLASVTISSKVKRGSARTSSSTAWM